MTNARPRGLRIWYTRLWLPRPGPTPPPAGQSTGMRGGLSLGGDPWATAGSLSTSWRCRRPPRADLAWRLRCRRGRCECRPAGGHCRAPGRKIRPCGQKWWVPGPRWSLMMAWWPCRGDSSRFGSTFYKLLSLREILTRPQLKLEWGIPNSQISLWEIISRISAIIFGGFFVHYVDFVRLPACSQLFK